MWMILLPYGFLWTGDNGGVVGTGGSREFDHGSHLSDCASFGAYVFVALNCAGKRL